MRLFSRDPKHDDAERDAAEPDLNETSSSWWTRGRGRGAGQPSDSATEAGRTYRWGRRKGQPRAHPRLRQRAAEVRRRPWRAVAVLAVVLALVGGVVYLLGFSSAFQVERVTVSGVQGDIADDAQAVGDSQLGRPMARVDTGAVEEQVLQDLRVATAEVRREWPSGLAIEVTIRKPSLTISQSGVSGFRLVDADGVVFNTIKEAPRGVPQARVLIRGDDLDPEQLVALQTLRESLPDSVTDQARELTLTRTGDIEFLVGNIEVLWGDGSNALLKGRVLEGLLDQEGLDPEAEPSYAGPIRVDLTTPSTPVVTGLSLQDPDD